MTASPRRVESRVKATVSSSKSELLISDPQQRPRLLVSVRSASEGQSAVAGGAEILDVKEPALGSLGMAPLEAITEIARLESIIRGTIPLSVALGEVADWAGSMAIPQLPAGITFAKLGLRGCQSGANWRAAWERIREDFQNASASRLKWVAVAYADAEQAAAPSIDQVLDAAVETGCAGLLIDTWSKGNRALLDFVDVGTIKTIADGCHQAGLFFALAGKISGEALPQISDISADIIAIRSAACRNADRGSQLDLALVTAFRNLLSEQFSKTPCGVNKT